MPIGRTSSVYSVSTNEQMRWRIDEWKHGLGKGTVEDGTFDGKLDGMLDGSIGMCVDMCVDMCACACVHGHLCYLCGICVDICVDMCVDIFFHMCAGMRVNMC